ncbi:hypothetical protein U0070_006766, partial [Myodes glareolus]
MDGQHVACGSKSGVENTDSQDSCLQQTSPKPIKAIVYPKSWQWLQEKNEESVRLVHLPSYTAFSNFLIFKKSAISRVQAMDFSPRGGSFALGNEQGKALLHRFNVHILRFAFYAEAVDLSCEQVVLSLLAFVVQASLLFCFCKAAFQFSDPSPQFRPWDADLLTEHQGIIPRCHRKGSFTLHQLHFSLVQDLRDPVRSFALKLCSDIKLGNEKELCKLNNQMRNNDMMGGHRRQTQTQTAALAGSLKTQNASSLLLHFCSVFALESNVLSLQLSLGSARSLQLSLKLMHLFLQ